MHSLACYELIHEKAQKCPHCHQIQSKLATVPNKPIVIAVMMIVFVGLMLYLLYSFRTITDSRAGQSLLAIESAELYTRRTTHGDFVSCTGRIANKSRTLEASYIDLRAEFFNNEDALIDSITENSNLKILSGETIPYRVRGQADKPLEEYARCSVTPIN